MQPRPLCPALYAISVRRLGTLPAASFRFHLAMDTLAIQLTLPTAKRVVDFHHKAIAHGGRTSKYSTQCVEYSNHQILYAVRRVFISSRSPPSLALVSALPLWEDTACTLRQISADYLRAACT